MKVDYDHATDILAFILSSAAVEESDEIKPGIIVDYDKQGNVVGLEILDASKRVDRPAAMEFAVKAA